LIGGLAPWVATHPGGGALEAALSASLTAARSPDDKLSRNGATAAHRLCQCDALAVVVAASEAGGRWLGALLGLYRERGGLRQRAGAGEDLSTQELLLLALCSVAVAAPLQPPQLLPQPPRRAGGGELLLQLVGPHVLACCSELESALAGHSVAARQQQPPTPAPAHHHQLTPLQQHHAQQLLEGGGLGGSVLGGGLHLAGGDCSCLDGASITSASHRFPCPIGPAAAATATAAPLHHWTTPTSVSSAAASQLASSVGASPAATVAAPAGQPPVLPEAVACLEALAAVLQGLQSSVPAARDPARASRQAVAAVLSRSAPRIAAASPAASSGGAGSTLSGGGSSMSMEDVSSGSMGGSERRRARSEQRQQDATGAGGGGAAAGAAGQKGASRQNPRQSAKQARAAARQEAACAQRSDAAAAAAAVAQQRGAAVAARDRRAFAVITQLLARSWDAIRLSYQVVSEGRPGWQTLLPAASGVLEVGLPAVQAQCEPPAAGDGDAAAAAAGGGELAGLARQCVAQVLLQLLRPLPAPLLQQPCCLRLLERALVAAGACGLLPVPPEASADNGPSAFSQHQQQQHQQQQQQQQQQQSIWAPGTTATDAALFEQQQAVVAAAHALLQRSLYEACVAMLQPNCSADPALTVAALQLAGSALRVTPQALVSGGVLELLMPATRVALHTQHLEQCSAALLWVQQLATAPFLEPLGDASAPAMQPPQWGAVVWRQQEAARRWAALSQIRAKLESGGEGAQIVLALLLAASGQMPPDVILAVSTCLHSIWRAAGGPAFSAWLDAAVMRLAPDGAPWVRNSRVAKLTFLRDLTDPSNWNDVGRFKRHIKSFCTGKKSAGGR